MSAQQRRTGRQIPEWMMLPLSSAKRFSMAVTWRRVTCFVSCLLACVVVGGCFMGADVVRDHIKGDYYFYAVDDESETSFVLDNQDTPYLSATIVDSTVTKAGWDSKWVLIEQFPHEPLQVRPSEIGPKRQYFIFSLVDEKLFGPYTKQKFVAQRMKLGVTATLGLTHQYVP